MELRRLVDVVHHVPGRMRLRLDPQLRGHPAAKVLGQWKANGSGVLSTRLNLLARSLVIEYDPKRIDPRTLEEFLTEADDERAKAQVETLAKIFGVPPQS